VSVACHSHADALRSPLAVLFLTLAVVVAVVVAAAAAAVAVVPSSCLPFFLSRHSAPLT